MEFAGRIEEMIAPTVEAMGYAIVRVQISGRQALRLQVMAERSDGSSISIDDCADISRAISALLDVEDPIPGAFTLEVSSPGLDRPLVRLADFDRFAGYEARIELGRMIDGRRRFTGRLAGTDSNAVRMNLGDTEVALPFEEISRAKLVLNNELLSRAEERSVER